MIKVVLDTNVIISGLNFPTSKPAKILKLAAFGIIKNYTSRHILNETDDILRKKFRWGNPECDSAKIWLGLVSKKVNPSKHINVISHQADNRILECAVAGRVEYIITGDKHILDIKKFYGIKIVTPQAFLEFI